MPVLTRTEIRDTIQQVVTERAVADHGALNETWCRMLSRVAQDIRLGGYELVCRPIVDEIVSALGELVPYLSLPAETVHPFIKPEGETKLIGYLTRHLNVIGRIRTSLHLFPGTALYDRRQEIEQYLDYREGIVREDIGIMQQNFRKTENPRTTVPGSQFVIMKVRTREFQELQRVYLLLLSCVIGKDAYMFFREQFLMVGKELAVMMMMCEVARDAPMH